MRASGAFGGRLPHPCSAGAPLRGMQMTVPTAFLSCLQMLEAPARSLKDGVFTPCGSTCELPVGKELCTS